MISIINFGILDINQSDYFGSNCPTMERPYLYAPRHVFRIKVHGKRKLCFVNENLNLLLSLSIRFNGNKIIFATHSAIDDYEGYYDFQPSKQEKYFIYSLNRLNDSFVCTDNSNDHIDNNTLDFIYNKCMAYLHDMYKSNIFNPVVHDLMIQITTECCYCRSTYLHRDLMKYGLR